MKALLGFVVGVAVAAAAPAFAAAVELECKPVIRPAPDCTLGGYFARRQTIECRRA